MLSSGTSLRLLEPYGASEFSQTHWERSTLVIHREDRDFFRDVLSLDEIDRLICSTRIPATNFNLARGDQPLPLSAYATGDYVDQERSLGLHRQGATIILRSVDQWSASLTGLRVEIEEAIGFEAQLNLYLTPPGEKSTPPHWDTHELFILQIHGSKRWRLFDSSRTLPLEDERFQIGGDCVGPLRQEIVLQAGDTLYLPRGTIHEPVAESYSIHVSIGVRTLRWFDMCTQMLKLLAKREGSPLRETMRAFPDGKAQGGLPAHIQQTLATAFAEPTLRCEAGELLHRQLGQRKAVERCGALLDTIHQPVVDPIVRYRRRGGVAVNVARVEGCVEVSTGLEKARLPARMESAVLRALSDASFTTEELPDTLSFEDRTVVCAALRQIGVLRTLDRATEGP
jgi:ribosomal protein L16 Arg81 hydroxylase